MIFPKIILTTRAVLFQPGHFIRSFVRNSESHRGFNDRYSRALTYLALSLVMFVLYGSVIEYIRQVYQGAGLKRAEAAGPEDSALDILQSIGSVYAAITSAVTSGEITKLFLFIMPVLVALAIHGWAVSRITRRRKRPIDFLTATQIAAYFLGALYLGFTLFVAIFLLPLALAGVVPTALSFTVFGLILCFISILIVNYVKVTAFLLGETVMRTAGVCLKAFALFYVGYTVVFLLALPLALPALDVDTGRNLLTRIHKLTGAAQKAKLSSQRQTVGTLLGSSAGTLIGSQPAGQLVPPGPSAVMNAFAESSISDALNFRDWIAFSSLIQNALERNRAGDTTAEALHREKRTGSATPGKPWQLPDGTYCREIMIALETTSRSLKAKASFCRGPDATWHPTTDAQRLR